MEGRIKTNAVKTKNTAKRFLFMMDRDFMEVPVLKAKG